MQGYLSTSEKDLPVPLALKCVHETLPFLKKPDFLLVDEEDIAECQHQLQEYHLFFDRLRINDTLVIGVDAEQCPPRQPTKNQVS